MIHVNQPETIELKIGNDTLFFDDLNRIYDCGNEIGVALSDDDIKKILLKNTHIAYDLKKWGNDTVVGDNFYCALIKEICGESLDSIKKKIGDDYYEHVKKAALAKGYIDLDLSDT